MCDTYPVTIHKLKRTIHHSYLNVKKLVIYVFIYLFTWITSRFHWTWIDCIFMMSDFTGLCCLLFCNSFGPLVFHPHEKCWDREEKSCKGTTCSSSWSARSISKTEGTSFSKACLQIVIWYMIPILASSFDFHWIVAVKISLWYMSFHDCQGRKI